MTQPLHDKLLACPFCGDDAAATQHVRDGRRAHCRSCGASACSAFHGPNDDTEKRAITAWNTRAELTRNTAIVDQLESAVRFAELFADLWEKEPNGADTLRAAIAFRQALATYRESGR